MPMWNHDLCPVVTVVCCCGVDAFGVDHTLMRNFRPVTSGHDVSITKQLIFALASRCGKACPLLAVIERKTERITVQEQVQVCED